MFPQPVASTGLAFPGCGGAFWATQWKFTVRITELSSLRKQHVFWNALRAILVAADAPGDTVS
jgi:hypothetical protein